MELETTAAPVVASPAPVQSNGDGYLSVDQALERAPADCVERDVEGVFGGKVRVRALTAAQSARVAQESLTQRGRNTEIAVARSQCLQFELGVIKPKFSAGQVQTLHLTSGASFAKVLEVINEISGTDEEELRTAQDAFRNAVD